MSDAAMSLLEAAQQMVTDKISVHDAEVLLAEAIEHGALPANIKRWATEQWEGRQLPGNLNRLETYIQAADLTEWLLKRRSV